MTSVVNLSCRRDERPIYFHRQLEGALNRVPYDFYDRVWHILERTPPGLKVAGYFLPQVGAVDVVVQTSVTYAVFLRAKAATAFIAS